MGVTELLWISILLKDIGMQIEGTMRLYCDNITAIRPSNNSVLHDRRKYMEIDIHFIRKKIDSKELILLYIKIQGQVADILTKGLSSSDFKKNVYKLHIYDMYAQFERKY